MFYPKTPPPTPSLSLSLAKLTVHIIGTEAPVISDREAEHRRLVVNSEHCGARWVQGAWNGSRDSHKVRAAHLLGSQIHTGIAHLARFDFTDNVILFDFHGVLELYLCLMQGD